MVLAEPLGYYRVRCQSIWKESPLRFVILETEGDYTLILSAFEPRHIGPLTLRVESSYRFDLKAIPQEGAGMYSKIIRGSW